MPFERDQGLLNDLVDKAVNEDQQIRDGLQEAGYEDRELYDEIAIESDGIWGVAQSEIRQYDTTEREHGARRERITKELGEPPGKDDASTGDAGVWIAVVGFIYFLGLVGWAVISLVRDWHKALGSLQTLPGWGLIGAAVAPLLVLIAIGTLVEKQQGRKQLARSANLKLQVAAWNEKFNAASAQYELDTLQSTLAAQKQNIEKLLYERVRQSVNAAINRRLEPSYSPIFSIKKPRGFGEVFDKRIAIQTPAHERLQFMLDNMPGGSIGIAGSRGAGKTTLLKLFCGPKRTIEKLKDKPVLGALVSAPVAYQAREFILYLFSTVCQNVIEAEGGEYKFPGTPRDAPAGQLVDAPTLVALRPLPSLLIRVGVVLTLVSLLLASGLTSLQPSPSATAASRPTAPTTTQAQAPATVAPAPPPVKPENESFAYRWIGQFKIDPAALLTWGIFLIVAGLMMAELLHLGAWRTFLISIGLLLRATIGIIPLFGRVTDAFLRTQLMKVGPLQLSAPVEEPAAQTPSEDSLQAHAETWLRAIKFQQSYTSGWSGALKLPIGLEGGVNRAVTLAQNQLSLPEIVYFLARFLEEVSLKYQVIIGIDEMDKLASDELAQQFLNDIKSIFGLERCFYLISVSENAMSNFERRGLPFRDAFDSSFDDFVYVDYLDFKSAMELLEQRVVGRPIPFFGMSYCMSGGLARDLIRSFRGVLEAYERNPGQNGLTAICQEIVRHDLLAKIRATRISAKKIKLESELDLFLEALYELEVGVDSDELLVEAARKLFAMDAPQKQEDPAPQPEVPPAQGSSQSGIRSVPPEPAARDEEHESRELELRELAQELGTYIYYAVTLRQLFNDEIKQSMLTQPPMGGSLDELAKARQILGVNPGITRARLQSFRAAHGLTAFL